MDVTIDQAFGISLTQRVVSAMTFFQNPNTSEAFRQAIRSSTGSSSTAAATCAHCTAGGHIGELEPNSSLWGAFLAAKATKFPMLAPLVSR